MQKTAVFSVIAGLVFLLSGTSSGQISGLDSLRISGYGAMEMGQMVRGWLGEPTKTEHKWQEHFFGKLMTSAYVNKRTVVEFGFEVHYQYSAHQVSTWYPSSFPGIAISLDRAVLNSKLFEGVASVSIQVGYFPFKYNMEARNLGEYLFRSGCYPTYVTNNFDFPLNRLLGFNVGNSLFPGNDLFSINQNFLLTSETETYPYGDVSLSYLVSANVLKKAFNIGGGICAHRIFPVDKTPHEDGANGTIAEINNVRPDTNFLGQPITVGDTTFFSFAGTKLMFHLTFDPKAFFQSDIFGKEDLKLYGELAILGVKNYPVYVDSANGIGTNPDQTARYDILKERMPIMLGFNIPTFKILDVLSFEWEYWENRYLNNKFNQIWGESGIRYPLPSYYSVLPENKLASNAAGKVKWSVYAKKQFNNMSIVAQCGRDHRQVYINVDPRANCFADELIRANDWYYLIKVGYGF